MFPQFRCKTLFICLIILCLTLLSPAPGLSVTAADRSCPQPASLRVPGAEHQKHACLDDLTTPGLLRSGHTVQADWAGLHSVQTPRRPGPYPESRSMDTFRTHPVSTPTTGGTMTPSL